MRRIVFSIALLACTVPLSGCEAFWIWMAVDARGGEEDVIEVPPPDPSGEGGREPGATSASAGGEGGTISVGSGGEGSVTSSAGAGGSGGAPPVCVPKTCDDFSYPACGELSDGCDGTLSCSGLVCPSTWQTCDTGSCACANAFDFPNYDNALKGCQLHNEGQPFYCGDGNVDGPPNCKQKASIMTIGDNQKAQLWCCE